MTIGNCSERYPTTDELFDDVSNNSAFIAVVCVCTLICVVTTAIFLEELWFLLNNHKPLPKRWRIIIILGMFPVISWTALLNVFVPTGTPITELLACIYLSVGILTFIHLMVDYFGGSDKMVMAFTGQTISFCTPPVCCCCLCLRSVNFAK